MDTHGPMGLVCMLSRLEELEVWSGGLWVSGSWRIGITDVFTINGMVHSRFIVGRLSRSLGRLRVCLLQPSDATALVSCVLALALV